MFLEEVNSHDLLSMFFICNVSYLTVQILNETAFVPVSSPSFRCLKFVIANDAIFSTTYKSSVVV